MIIGLYLELTELLFTHKNLVFTRVEILSLLYALLLNTRPRAIDKIARDMTFCNK